MSGSILKRTKQNQDVEKLLIIFDHAEFNYLMKISDLSEDKAKMSESRL